MSGTKEPVDIVRACLLECIAGDPERVHQFMSDEFGRHGRDRSGPEFAKRAVKDWTAAHGAISVTIHQIFGKDDLVACSYTLGFADGSKQIDATDIFRVRDDKICEVWGQSNSFY